MSTAGTIDLPLEIFSGYVPEIAPSDLPAGASPDCRDVEFPLGSWKTRGGLGGGVFAALAGNPTINYQKTFIDQQRNKRFLFLDATGSLNQEFPQGTVVDGINTIPVPAGAFAKSTTAYGHEYIAFSDGQFGIADPTEWNGLYYDRCSQVGPGSSVATIADLSYQITAISRTSGLTTLTIAVPLASSGLAVGQLVNITGVNADPTLNGQFPIVSLAGTTSTTITCWGNPGIWNVNSLTRAGNVVTAVLQQSPTFTGTPSIVIGSAGDSSFDGEFAVTSINGNVVTWNQVAANASTLTAILYTSATSSPLPIVLAENNAAMPGAPADGFVFEVPGSSNVGAFFVGTSVTIAGNSVGAYNINVIIQIGPQLLVNGNIGFQAALIGGGASGLGTGGTATPALPDSAPTVSGMAGPAGNIPTGPHQVSLFFVLRSGYYTRPAPPIVWFAAGGFKATVTGIPTGNAQVLQRILVFTEAQGATFYFTTNASNELVSGNMVVNDNVTTTGIFDFSDVLLVAGSNAQYLFSLLELEASAGVVSYATRLFWWGGRNRIPNFLNMSFNGGTNSGTGTASLPLGWKKGTNYTWVTGGNGGGIYVLPSGYWAFQLQSPSANQTGIGNMITQPAFEDYLGNPILLPNTAYSVRFKIALVTAGFTPSNLIVEFFSPSAGSLATATTSSATFTATLTEQIIAFSAMTPAAIPADTILRVYLNTTAGAVNPTQAYMTNLEIFPTLVPFLTTTARASYAGQPESYDELTGVVQPYFQDGGTIRNMFVLRGKLYALKDTAWFETKDDESNEPSAWTWTPVSLAVGAAGVNSSDLGEDWGIIANRAGPYIFWGGQPVKIGQEVESDSSNQGKPTWSSINWAFGYTIWVVLDRVNKRALIGAPINGATSPNVIFYFDYVGLDTAQEVADHWSVKYSAYTGKILAIGNAPKWAPWNISSNSAALIERNDGTAHTFIGNGAAAPYFGLGPSSTGKIYDLLETNKSDDGVGIAWKYMTYLTPSHMEEQALQIKSHRKLYSYLSGFVKGSGLMAISMQPMGNITPVPNLPLQLVDPTVSNAVTSVKRQNGVTTVTCAGGHGLTNGIDVQAVLANTLDPSFNGTFPIQQILNAQQFTIGQYFLADLIVNAGGTVTRLSREFEFTTNVLGERVSYIFSNQGNAAGTWAQMEKLVFSIVPDPWSPVRGSVY